MVNFMDAKYFNGSFDHLVRWWCVSVTVVLSRCVSAVNAKGKIHYRFGTVHDGVKKFSGLVCHVP